MTARAVWADLVVRYYECRTNGHRWERAFYGDAIRDVRGTHRCARCHRIGYADPPPNDGPGEPA